MLVDSHCHLDFTDFDADRDAVLARAKAAGVELMVTISTKVSEADKIIALAEAHAELVCSVGIHPHEAGSEAPVTGAQLVALAAHEKVVGIGETGLDYFYEHSPREAQQKNFRAHIEAARISKLPLIVHARDADEDTADILEDEMQQGAYPGLIHCFTAGPELARRALDIGFYISISGIATFHWVLHFDFGHCHVQQCQNLAPNHRKHSAGAAFGRDGRTVSRTCAASWQTQ